jgi:23S rRNA (adenine2503-C2)-methyltransferase
MTRAECAELAESMGEPAYRGFQLFKAVNACPAQPGGLAAATALPKALRGRLSEESRPIGLTEADKIKSASDGTIKYLFAAGNNTIIESVLTEHSYGHAVCVSSQAGCAMGCAFCHTGRAGFTRDLTAGEMAAQVYLAARDALRRPYSVVVMGMGEPLLNFAALTRFLEIITDPEGAGMSRRRITVSTCGIKGRIARLADTGFGVNLALSLHAPDDGLRRRLMPSADAAPIADLLAECAYYFEKTGRRVTYEYILLAGINDGASHAAELARLTRGAGGHVNLIPVNGAEALGFTRPSGGAVRRFAAELAARGVNATIRRSLGEDLSAACGQLIDTRDQKSGTRKA